jgi:hypothetical protein
LNCIDDDVQRDPFQMQNLLDTGYEFLAEHYTLADRSFRHIVTRLDALLMVLKSCKGETCRKPWSVLHPDGTVQSLRDSLNGDLDVFYAQQPKVAFDSCVLGHIVEEEGPQAVNVWKEDDWPVGNAGVGQQVLGRS